MCNKNCSSIYLLFVFFAYFLLEMKETEKKKYPIGPEQYVLYEEIGQGVSASVYRALCVALDEIVAIKILDFERDNCDLNNVSREAQTMTLVDHPNVLKSHCSFVCDHNLWVVMPFMAGGSCLHILKAIHPNGLEEAIIATILREVLKGLEYLHHQGHIHRDVKAGNILIGGRGVIKLGDFGVSACLFDSGDRQRMRNTFVGTPCWMAPEVLEQLHGYDCKADIWSFGITALELAHGHAPFSKFPPMKVLLMTLQNAPPGLDYERDKKFSKSFKNMIAICLVKDPSKRPTAQKLLKHSFFKQARSTEYIARKLLEGLPTLGDRILALKKKEEDMLAQKKMPDGQMEELSQNEYKRGISSWNFNLDDMKAQASLDFDDPISELDAQDNQSPNQKPVQIADTEDNGEIQNQIHSVPRVDSTVFDAKVGFEKSDDDCNMNNSNHEHHFSQNSLPHPNDLVKHNLGEKTHIENAGRSLVSTVNHSFDKRGSSSSFLPEAALPPIRGESEKLQNQPQNISNRNATDLPPAGEDVLCELNSKASKSSANSEDIDDKAKVPVIQQRGRFKVTSENVDLEKVGPSPVLQKSHSMQIISPLNPVPLPSNLLASSLSEVASSNVHGSSVFSELQSVLHTNTVQREIILSLMRRVNANDIPANGGCTPAQVALIEKSLLESAHDREKELLQEVSELRRKLLCTQEEIQKLKSENTQCNFIAQKDTQI